MHRTIISMSIHVKSSPLHSGMPNPHTLCISSVCTPEFQPQNKAFSATITIMTPWNKQGTIRGTGSCIILCAEACIYCKEYLQLIMVVLWRLLGIWYNNRDHQEKHRPSQQNSDGLLEINIVNGITRIECASYYVDTKIFPYRICAYTANYSVL